MAAPGWSPTYFSGPAATALRAGSTGQSISDLGGRVLEGWRVSETLGALLYDPRAAKAPIYRQANIRRLRLLLAEQHWASPQISGRWCVQPDDVVLNKLAPVRAAYVSPNARRHPVDSNTLIVRGLSNSAAAWVALCLNQASYEQLLLIASGLLKRVGLRTVASLRVPSVPSEMEGLSARLRDLIDEATLATEALHRARGEANAEATAAPRREHDLFAGAFFACDAVSNESWLPATVALHAEQSALEDEVGWVPLVDLATFDDRARLTRAHGGARPLRLSDVGDELLVGDDLLVDGAPSYDLIPSRTLAKPLVPGEVLVSTLGSSFRAAYVDDDVPPNTHPVDGWVRLRFRETPAAWALLLSTDPLRSQAAHLTVGSVQQFVRPDALRSLRLPAPPRQVRDRWQRAVERHHAQRRSIDRRWAVLASELLAVFDTVHKPFSSPRSHAKEELQ
jgi:hypothetical protein